jgi:hypothetical protein
MQRGKPSVQHYDHTAPNMLKTRECGTDKSIILDCSGQDRTDASGAGEKELAGRIVEQLRFAYDELLHEPIPDHLRKLLSDLSDREDKA